MYFTPIRFNELLYLKSHTCDYVNLPLGWRKCFVYTLRSKGSWSLLEPALPTAISTPVSTWWTGFKYSCKPSLPQQKTEWHSYTIYKETPCVRGVCCWSRIYSHQNCKWSFLTKFFRNLRQMIFFSEIFAIPFLWSRQVIWLLNLIFIILSQQICVLVWGQDCSTQILDQDFP